MKRKDMKRLDCTFRLEVNQVEGHPCSTLPSITIEGCKEMGKATIYKGYVNQYPQNERCPFDDKECYTIIGSFDPNDILVTPEGYGDKHYIEPETELEYKIRFQNVGNDTAFNIYVFDTLPNELDVESI